VWGWLQLLPSDASVLTNYGHLLFELRRNYSGAEQAYRQALRVDPQVPALTQTP